MAPINEEAIDKTNDMMDHNNNLILAASSKLMSDETVKSENETS